MFDKIAKLLKDNKENLKKGGALLGALAGLLVVGVAMLTNSDSPVMSPETEENLSYGEQNELNQ